MRLLPLLPAFAFAAPATAAAFNPPDVSVQLFRWPWEAIARECRGTLGPAGYGAVQVSPPQAARVTGNWWDMYQPVNFASLRSRMGDEAGFAAMIASCHRAGVRVYVDVVSNHMAAGSGTAGQTSDGSSWDSATLSYPQFSAGDFHPPCTIRDNDYGTPGDRRSVTECRLLGLPDLAQENAPVRAILLAYLGKLLALGADGFRIDAAKHQAPGALRALFDALRQDWPVTRAGEPVWIAQEVIPDGNVNRRDYLPIGRLNEFKFSYALRDAFRGNDGLAADSLPALIGVPGAWGGSWGLLDSSEAVVFVNNWDTERSNDTLNASNESGAGNDVGASRRYDLATIFMLAWPYGQAQIQSGFRFTQRDADAPSTPPLDDSGAPQTAAGWDMVHRWADITAMIAFRHATAGLGVDHWQTGSRQQIAFGRGGIGFVALNNDMLPWRARVQTGLPAGRYCNVVAGLAADGNCRGDTLTVDAQGTLDLDLPPNDGRTVPAVALYLRPTARNIR
ncbi:alpha-amylase [Paludibacterium yongneupense]|uniref:alpha-amylase n=1 Tax=Paludibacterium yongneupense TaxID=400061 RepID=UPI00040E391D|nr:alpha-amylase family protein [Paludibacterium yongneupense]